MISEKLEREVTNFELSVQRREDLSSRRMAHDTLKLLKKCVEECHVEEELEERFIYLTKRLQSAVPTDVIVANFCVRVMDLLNKILNESAPIFDPSSTVNDVKRSQSLSLLEILISSSSSQKLQNDHVTRKIKDAERERETEVVKSKMIKGINKMMEEIPEQDKESELFNQQDVSFYIHDGDILMTVGSSSTVASFFVRAFKNHKFSVIVTEHAPSYDGLKMAEMLKSHGIDCIVIPDSAVFAVMPRVTTVFCPCRAIFADGTLVTKSFAKSVCLAARHHSKPFVIIYWMSKLTDRFLKPKDSFTVLASPNDIVPIDDDSFSQNTTILNPDGECFSGTWVTLFINEKAPHGSADIFTLVHDLYHQND